MLICVFRVNSDFYNDLSDSDFNYEGKKTNIIYYYIYLYACPHLFFLSSSNMYDQAYALCLAHRKY